MARRWALVLLVAAAAGGGAALAQGMDPAGPPTYLPEDRTECWRCHSAPVGGAPAVEHFAAILPPAMATAAPGSTFPYQVEMRNTWSGQLTYVEPVLDLAGAPSLGFAADVPPVRLHLEDAIAVSAGQPSAPHAKAHAVQLGDGLTHLRIRIEPLDGDPATGPDLALNVTAGRHRFVEDDNGRGGAEELLFDGREDFAGIGYGNWTVAAEVTPLRVRLDDPAGPGGPSLAGLGGGEVPFRLVVEGEARESGERVLGLPMSIALPAGQSASAMFQLVALALPAAPERAEARLQAHIHYKHSPSAQAVDDADLLAPAVSLDVAAVAGQVAVVAGGLPDLAAPVADGPTMAAVAESVGYASGFLLLSSTWAGGAFGKASRRQMNALFGSARRRVAFHNFVSYGLIAAALSHTVLFLVEAAYGWTVGLLWGGLAVLAMLGLGLTGALQVPIIRRWSFASWRRSHLMLALGAALLTVAHVALDGVHFAPVQEALGWRDPLAAVPGTGP